MYRYFLHISVLFCALFVFACGGTDEDNLSDTGTAPVDVLGDLVGVDAGCIEGPQPDDPCMTCSCDEGEWNCIPAQIGSSCAVSDCCIGSAVCVVCDPADPDSCPDSGLQCEGSFVKSCTGADQCSFDVPSCVDGACECVAEAQEDGLECDFNANDCTVGDQCIDGECVVGSLTPRSDDNPCTVGTCVKGEIQQSPIDGSCSDNNPCTTGDFCQEGLCMAGDEVQCVPDACSLSATCDPAVGSCVQEPAMDGTICEDSDPCVLSASCQAGACTPTNLKACPSSGACFTGICDSNSGACVEEAKPEGASCEHSNFCVAESVCEGGACVMTLENDCDDGNPCTLGVCNQTGTGGCVQSPVPDGSSCISGDPCAQTSVCVSGSCETLTLIACEDGNACTQDNCNAITGLCEHPDVSDGIECGILDNSCVLAAQCFSGDCAATEAVVCNDGNSCTVGSCDPANGTCTHVPLDEGALCAPGSACFLGGSCSGQECIPSDPVICSDDEPCTDDVCHNIFGCQFTNNTSECDDGSVCTLSDHCVDGLCESEGVQDCDDNDPCTLDTCDADGGCSSVINPEGCQHFYLDEDDTFVFDVSGLSNCGPWSYDRDCPPGHVAVGYFGTIDGPLESITLDCRKLLGDGSLGESASGTTFGADSGGSVFSPDPCASDRLLNGMEINVGTWWTRVVGHCHSLSSIVNHQAGYEATIAPVADSVGGPSYFQDCPAGYTLTGFYGRAASVGICRVGAKCTRLVHAE